MLLGVTVPLILIYQSIPLIWFYYLYQNHSRLDPPIADAAAAYKKRATDHTIQHLRFLFGDYRCKMYFYEVGWAKDVK